jgi:phage-related protein
MDGKTITQRIALEGGKEIQTQLEAIGGAGQKAFQNLKDAADKVSSSSGGIASRFDAIANSAAELRSKLDDVGSALKTTAERFTILVGAAAAGGAALIALAQKGASAADAAGKSAASAGLSAESFQKLQFAFGQSGVTGDEFIKVMRNLNESLTATGNNKAKETLDRLGITLQKTADGGIDMEKLLADVGDKFKSMPDGATKSGAAIELFGKRVGTQLIPFLNNGSAGIKKFGDEAVNLGVVFSAEQIRIGTILVEASKRFTDVFGALSNQIGLVFAPLLTKVFNAAVEVIGKIRQPILDFVKFIADNVSGPVNELIAAALGHEKEVKTSWVILLVDALKGLGVTALAVFAVMKTAFEGLVLAAKPLELAINSIFGTNFTAQQLVVIGLLTQFLGIFTLVARVASLVASAVGLLATIFGGWAAAIILVVAGFAVLIATNQKFREAVIGLWAAFVADFQTTWQKGLAFVIGLFNSIVGAVQGVFSTVASTINGAIDSVVGFVKSLSDQIVSTFNDAVNSVIGFFSGLVDRVMGFFKTIIDGAKSVVKAISDATSTGSGGSGDQSQGFAGGGHVRGPGTSTSDSIRGWLSNGEFVMPTRAVEHFGLSFMEMIRRLRNPFDAFRSGFADGGLVRAISPYIPPTPHFSVGGLVAVNAGSGGSNRILNLHIGGRQFGGLTGPSNVLDELERFAVGENIRSAGRAPSWKT